jgi:ribosome-associated heat shock protein Hsp15
VGESDRAAALRVDVWTWAVRLFATRSTATAACRGGHVRVNGAPAKPAHPVRLGDTVRAITPGGERIVVVTGLPAKRLGAALAVQNYEDRSPAPVPRTERPAPVSRERGAGRPTKRERRQTDRLRGRPS